MIRRLGVVQGRLSPRTGDEMQEFPVATWEKEFFLARDMHLELIEWVVGKEGFSNPIFSPDGQESIRRCIKDSGVGITSVCMDYFMAEPLFSFDGYDSSQAAGLMQPLLKACSFLEVPSVEMPLFGQQALDTEQKEDGFVSSLSGLLPLFEKNNVNVLLELGLDAERANKLLSHFPEDIVFVNYDTGNSLYFGYEMEAEFSAYGNRVASVHIKDCTKEAYSVPLGEGDLDLDKMFAVLDKHNYNGPLIFQAFHAKNIDPLEEMNQYISFLKRHMPTEYE